MASYFSIASPETRSQWRKIFKIPRKTISETEIPIYTYYYLSQKVDFFRHAVLEHLPQCPFSQKTSREPLPHQTKEDSRKRKKSKIQGILHRGEAKESLRIAVKRDVRIFNKPREHSIQQDDGGTQKKYNQKRKKES